MHQSTAASTWWCGHRPIWVGSKWLLASPRVPVTLGTLVEQTIFLPCCPLNDRRRAARSFFKIGRLFSLFSSLSPASLHLLILLMSSHAHFNFGLVFSCSVCAGNVTWRGKSVQCRIYSKWVHLRYSLLSLSKNKTLGSSHSWSCTPCCIPASSGDNTVTSSSDSCSLYISTVQSAPSLLMQHSRPTLACKPPIPLLPTLYLFPLLLHHCLLLLAVSLHLLLPLPH